VQKNWKYRQGEGKRRWRHTEIGKTWEQSSGYEKENKDVCKKKDGLSPFTPHAERPCFQAKKCPRIRLLETQCRNVVWQLAS
jgi:hypothetical protein